MILEWQNRIDGIDLRGASLLKVVSHISQETNFGLLGAVFVIYKLQTQLKEKNSGSYTMHIVAQ